MWYSDAYVLVSDTITITRGAKNAADTNKRAYKRNKRSNTWKLCIIYWMQNQNKWCLNR